MKTFTRYGFIRRSYLKLFSFLAKHRLRLGDLEPQKIHVQIIATLATSILMFSYAVLAIFTMPPVVGVLCGLTSIIHLGSIFLYRFTPRTDLVANIVLTTGLIQTIIFSYNSNGFWSFSINWLGIIPVFAGIFNGRRGALIWFVLNFLTAMVFLTLNLTGYEFPVYASDAGHLWAKSVFIFGWILLGTVMVIVYNEINENTRNILREQNQKIEDLFRVLFHDLANTLGRLSIGLTLAKSNEQDSVRARGIEISTEATNSMLEITQNIRKLYAVRHGKVSLTPVLTPLTDAVDYVQAVYAREIREKNLTIAYDREKNSGVNLLVEPVSFKNQVLGNIISNAVKFSRDGGTISISVTPLEKHLFSIEIRDNGIGMPESMIQCLFDLSKKTSRPGTKGEPGTGFGMYIMKSYMEMYDGQVSVESLEARKDSPSGTVVRLTLRGEGTQRPGMKTSRNDGKSSTQS